MTAHTLLIGYVVVARLAELAVARRNTKRLMARGGFEVGRDHYPLIVATHTAWILALAFLVPSDSVVDNRFLVLFLVAQIVRYWVILSLGPRWTTRIIVVPGEPLVTRGPYRWLRHPNYLVVAAEIALLPLVFGAWEIAIGFSVVNAAILWKRIRVEERALGLLTEKA